MDANSSGGFDIQGFFKSVPGTTAPQQSYLPPMNAQHAPPAHYAPPQPSHTYGVADSGNNFSVAPLSGYPGPLHGPPAQMQQSSPQMLPFPPPVQSTPSSSAEAYQNYMQYMQTTGQTPPPLPYGPPPYQHPQQHPASGVFPCAPESVISSSVPPASVVHGPNSPVGGASLDGARLMAMLHSSASKDVPGSQGVSTTGASVGDSQPSAGSTGVGEGSEFPLSYGLTSQNSGEFRPAATDISEPPPALIPSQPTAPPVSLAPTPSSVDFHLQPRKGKKPSGRVLLGNHIIYDTDERLPGESQPQLEVSPITVYGSEYVLALGRQVAVNRSYIVYGLRAGHIRILNINTATRALLRGHSARISDMAFFAEDVHLLITASVDGRVIIRRIEEILGADGKSVIKEWVIMAVRFVGPWEMANPRVVWHPHQQDHVMVSCSRFVFAIEVFRAATAIGMDNGALPENVVDCSVDHPIEGVHLLSGHLQDVTDMAIPPGIATRLASASLDGAVRIWTHQRVCVSSFTPYGGQPVSTVAFLDAPGRHDDCVLITGGPLNRELKLWVSSVSESASEVASGGDWRCIQTLELTSSKSSVEGAFFNQVIVVQNASLVLVANAKRNAIYGVHVAFGPVRGSARMDYIAEFSVTMPILSFTASGDSIAPDSSEGTMQIFCVQTQAIQQYSLDLSQCLPQHADSIGAAPVALQAENAESSTGDSLTPPDLGDSEPKDSQAASLLLGPPLQPISTETRSKQRVESPTSRKTETADGLERTETHRGKEVDSSEMPTSGGLSEPAAMPPDAPQTTPSAPPIVAAFSSPQVVVAPVPVVGEVDLAVLSARPASVSSEENAGAGDSSAAGVLHLVTPLELLGTAPQASAPVESLPAAKPVSLQGQDEATNEARVLDTTSSSGPGKAAVETGEEVEKRETRGEEEAVSTSQPCDVSSSLWSTARDKQDTAVEGAAGDAVGDSGTDRLESIRDSGHGGEDPLSLANKARETVAGKKGAATRDLPRTYGVPGIEVDKREIAGEREGREPYQFEGKEDYSEGASSGGASMPLAAGIVGLASTASVSALSTSIPHLPPPTTILPGAVSAGGVVKSRKNKNKAGGVATTASGPLPNVPPSPVLLPRNTVLASSSSGNFSDLAMGDMRSAAGNGSDREAGSGNEGIGAEGSGEGRIARTSSRDNLGLVGQVLGMQETMLQLLAMQKELQKQLVLAVSMPIAKEGKRIEAAIGQRLEKVLKAHSDALWARLQEDSARREDLERERTVNIASTVVKAVSKELPGVFERILNKELSALGPAIASMVQPGLDAAAVTAMNDAIQRAVHERVMPGLEKMVVPKVDSLVSRQGQLQATVRQALQDGLKVNFQSSVIPALEGSCKAMFEQIDSTFQQGLAEHASLVQQHISSSQGGLASSLQESVLTASTLAATLRDEITEGHRRLVVLAEQAATAGRQNAPGHARKLSLNGGVAGIPLDKVLSLEHVEQSLDPTIELSRLVAERKHEEAFTKALSLSDVSIVSWLCQQVDPALVFAQTPIPLSQRVLLSLIQQLSCDLGSNLGRKLAWIREAVLAMNPTDPLLVPHMKPILEHVYSQVYRQAGQVPPGGELSASVRLVMHLLLSLKGDYVK